MTNLELAKLLSRTVANAPNGEKTNAYVMFGIKYAGDLGSRTNAVADLARRNWPEAGLKLSSSMQVDVGYGVRLARYVAITNPPAVVGLTTPILAVISTVNVKKAGRDEPSGPRRARRLPVGGLSQASPVGPM